MKFQFSHSLERITVLDDQGVVLKAIWAASHVRNELTHERPAKPGPDVFHTLEGDGTPGPASMPRPYPLGTWKVTGMRATGEKWLQPLKFLTDAHQPLDVWILDDSGQYLQASTKKTEDYGYRIHFDNGSAHTEGCIGVKSLDDLLWLAKNATSFPISLEVVP